MLYFRVSSTGAQAGLVEFLQGAESVDKIKKALQAQALLQQQQQQGAFSAPSPSTSPPALLPSLKQYFELQFGESYSFFYAKAVKNFVKSLVGYSLLTYVVQVSFVFVNHFLWVNSSEKIISHTEIFVSRLIPACISI